MIQRIGNTAFRALSDVLDLPGTIHLADVDIGASFPVVDLLPMIEVSELTHWTLHHEEEHLAADDTTFSLRPQVSGDWNLITRWDQESAEAIPENHDVLVVQATASKGGSVAANLDNLVVWRVGGAGGTLSEATQQTMAYWDTALSGLPALSRAGGDTQYLQRPPWFVRDFNPLRQGTTIQGRLRTSAAFTAFINFRCWSAPAGVFPRHIGR